MMLATVNPQAAAAIGKITKVGIGNTVVYHARAGYMRDRRSSFPAVVLRQHEEDGSLDLLVFMEREDFATEERVTFRSHDQPHHCWSAVEDAPGRGPPLMIAPEGGLSEVDPGFMPGHVTFNREHAITMLAAQNKELTARVEALEAKRKPGRPAKLKAA